MAKNKNKHLIEKFNKSFLVQTAKRHKNITQLIVETKPIIILNSFQMPEPWTKQYTAPPEDKNTIA